LSDITLVKGQSAQTVEWYSNTQAETDITYSCLILRQMVKQYGRMHITNASINQLESMSLNMTSQQLFHRSRKFGYCITEYICTHSPLSR